MRKVTAFLLSVLLVWLTLLGTKAYYAAKVHELYYDKVGDDNSLTVSKSYILQSEAARTNDNVFVFGSSELDWAKDFSTHISHVFNHRAVGYQPHLVGRAGFDQLAHILNIGALGSVLHSQKIVFIISPQWFTRQFVDDDNLNINIAPLFYYRFFLNPELSFHLKNTVARIVVNLEAIKKNKSHKYDKMRDFCDLYTKDDRLSLFKRILSWPYYRAMIEVLELQDAIRACQYLQKNKVYPKRESGGVADIDWQRLKDEAFLKAMEQSNNAYLMDDDQYWHFINSPRMQNSIFERKMSLRNDKLYEEIEILMDLYDELDLDPLMVNIPFNALWDGRFSVKASERKYCYERVDNIVTVKHSEALADLTDKEKEPYFFMDAYHLGWIGWVYVDEAIYNYLYNKKQKSVLH